MGVDPATGAVTGCFWLTPLGLSQATGYIKFIPGDDTGLQDNIYSTVGTYYVYTSKSAPIYFQKVVAGTNQVDGASSNDVYGAVVRDFMVGFNAGYYGETGNPLNPQLSNNTDNQVNLNQEANWDSSYAYGQNTTSTPGYQFYNAYGKIFQLYSNAYGFGYSDALENDSNPSPLLPVYDESSTPTANVATVNLTVYSPNADPAQTGSFTPPTVYDYIAAPAVQNNLYAVPTDLAVGDNIQLSFQTSVAGTYQAIDIAQTDTITLNILTGYEGNGTPVFASVVMNGATAGQYGLWQVWTIYVDGSGKYAVKTNGTGLGTGNMNISDIPVADPIDGVSNPVSWYQIDVSNPYAHKTYNLYTTTATYTPPPGQGPSVTQFLNTNYEDPTTGSQADKLQIDGGAAQINSPDPAPPPQTSPTFTVVFAGSRGISYGPNLAISEADSAATPPATWLAELTDVNPPPPVVTLADDIATFNGETTGGLYGIDIPSASLGAFSGKLIDSNTTLAADGKTPCVNLTLGGTDAFPISDGLSPCEIVMDGTGTLTLTAVNNYSGGTTVNSGTLVIQNGATSGTGATTIGSGAREIIASGGSAGSQAIAFSGAGATLEIDAPATGWTFANTLENFGVGDTLDLAGMPALFDANVSYSAGVLTVTSDNTSESFNLSGTSATSFAISEDAQGGVQIAGANTGSSTLTDSVTVYSEAQLDDAISYLNARAWGSYTITFGGVIGESSTPLAFNLQSGVTATLDGGGYTLDGNTGWGGLSVTSGDVTIENLTVVNTIASVPAAGKLVNVGFWNDNAVVNSGANSTFSMAGSNNSLVLLGSGGAITLSGTSLGSDTVTGSNDTIALDNATASILGGGDTIDFAGGAGNAVSLSWTGAATTYSIAGFISGDTIALTGLTGAYAPAVAGGALPSSFTLAINGNVVTQTNADGSQLVSTFNITGQSYTSTVEALDSSGNMTAFEYGGLTDAGYNTVKYLFSGTASSGYSNAGWNLYYAGQASGLTELDFDGSGRLSHEFYTFAGATPGALTALEIGYVAGMRADSLYTTVGPGGTSFTAAIYEYNYANQYVGATYTFTGATYATIQVSFTPGASPTLTETTYSHYTGAGGPNAVSYFYDKTSGALTGVQQSFTGITGQAYTSDEVLYNASGVTVGSEYSGFTSQPFSTLTYFDDAGGAVQYIALDYTSAASDGSIDGQAYSSHETILNASDALVATAYHLDNGGNVYIGAASGVSSPVFGGSGVTPNAAELANALPGGDWTITGGGTGETFHFAALFNSAEITDYGAAFAAATDIVSVSTADFANWQTLLGSAAASGGGANTTFTSATTGDRLTLDGVTVAQLAALTPAQANADFKFHA